MSHHRYQTINYMNSLAELSWASRDPSSSISHPCARGLRVLPAPAVSWWASLARILQEQLVPLVELLYWKVHPQAGEEWAGGQHLSCPGYGAHPAATFRELQWKKMETRMWKLRTALICHEQTGQKKKRFGKIEASALMSSKEPATPEL